MAVRLRSRTDASRIERMRQVSVLLIMIPPLKIQPENKMKLFARKVQVFAARKRKKLNCTSVL
jgi:hypothetical protein